MIVSCGETAYSMLQITFFCKTNSGEIHPMLACI